METTKNIKTDRNQTHLQSIQQKTKFHETHTQQMTKWKLFSNFLAEQRARSTMEKQTHIWKHVIKTKQNKKQSKQGDSLEP